MHSSSDKDLLKRHKDKWDALARENDRYYVRSVDHEQSDEEFDASGRSDVDAFILGDAALRARVAPFSNKVVLEIGCGSGRITKSLARLFRHVIAVDISPTMLGKAQEFVCSHNVTFIESDGARVPAPPESADLAFSYIVYQHFPSHEAIRESFHGVWRALRPGGLFKAQIRGKPHADASHWSWGPHCDEASAAQLAQSTGYRVITTTGVGTRSFWLLLEKSPSAL